MICARSFYMYLAGGLAATVLAAASARADGLLETLDGRTLNGTIQFAADAVLVASNKSEPVRVPWAEVRRVAIATPPEAVLVTGDPLPPGWSSADIGRVNRPGRTTGAAGGRFTLEASGFGAWGPDDSCHFAWRELDGDFQIMARIVELDSSLGKIEGGVMVRAAMGSNAPMAAACLHENGEVRLNRRPPGNPREFQNPRDLNLPVWVRLTRQGQHVAAYRSSLGDFWELMDSDEITLPEKVLVGLSAWTLANTSLSKMVMDSVRIIPGTPAVTLFTNSLPAGIVLRDGTFEPGEVTSISSNRFVLERDGAKRYFDQPSVSSLIFSPAPRDVLANKGRQGVWLTSGDLIEGTFVGFKLHWGDKPAPQRLRVSLNSLLLGIKDFDVFERVIAVFLADVSARPAKFLVVTDTGAVRRVTNVELREGLVIADGQELSGVRELERLPAGK